MIDPIWQGLSDELILEIEAGIPLAYSRVVEYAMLFEDKDTIRKEMPLVAKHDLKVWDLSSVHHAYHLALLLEQSPGFEPTRIIEWGAGYGSLCRIALHHFPECEYHIIDLDGPIMAQQRYLADVPGFDRVFFWDLWDLENVPEGDLFISTWALSESQAEAHDYVIDERNWFGCDSLLLAYQIDKSAEGFVGSDSFVERVHGIIGTTIPAAMEDGRNFYTIRTKED